VSTAGHGMTTVWPAACPRRPAWRQPLPNRTIPAHRGEHRGGPVGSAGPVRARGGHAGCGAGPGRASRGCGPLRWRSGTPGVRPGVDGRSRCVRQPGGNRVKIPQGVLVTTGPYSCRRPSDAVDHPAPGPPPTRFRVDAHPPTGLPRSRGPARSGARTAHAAHATAPCPVCLDRPWQRPRSGVAAISGIRLLKQGGWGGPVEDLAGPVVELLGDGVQIGG
jgi:hypothetical protein